MDTDSPIQFPVDDDTVRKWSALPLEALAGSGGAVLLPAVALEIVSRFLGVEWLRRVWSGDSPFLRFTTAAPMSPFTIRVVDLAEMLLNLQCVPGFEQRLTDLRPFDVESAVGELEGAKRMYARGWSCRFIKPSGKPGSSYDAEAELPCGARVAVEFKSKVEATVLSEDTIEDTIQKARRQLPSDRPGIVYVRLPHPWAAVPGAGETLQSAVRKTLRNTQRITAVHFHWEVFSTTTDGRPYRGVMVRDFINDRAKFRPRSLETLERCEGVRPWRSLPTIVPQLAGTYTHLV